MASNVGNAQARFFKMLEKYRRKSYDDRYFYHPDDIRAWMLAKDENDASNVAHLLPAVSSRDTFHARLDDIQSAMVVFAVLVSIGCGDLLTTFVQYFQDSNLDQQMRNSMASELAQSLLQDPSKTQEIIQRFERSRWAFIPASIEDIHRQRKALTDGTYILPFCKKERAGSGGTAVVFKVLIQADLIPDTLREELEGSEVDDDHFGKCYQLAVKSYEEKDRGPFETEKKNFQGIRKIEGVVKYLGWFAYKGSCEDDFRRYNILLEYGEQDLEEYLADAYPPVLNSEIISFWKKIFRVAKTLENFHSFQYERPDGGTIPFDGWHGDIKPSNILFVQQQFKLADFGYAKFEVNSQQMSPTTEIHGLTYTYGAPECDPGRLRKKTSTRHTQEIDTWSFGCVLSSVATWVVLGSFAYDQYQAFRRRAISDLLEQRKVEDNHIAPKARDGFHDGRHVLQAVKDWHQYLRSSMRRSDTITGKVLDLVEDDMLLANPKDRLSSKTLVRRLEKLIGKAKHEYSEAVKDHEIPDIPHDMLKALLDLDYTVPSSTGTDESRRTARPREQSQRTIRANKTERIGEMVIAAKVAGRQEVLESMLGTTIGAQLHIHESPALGSTDWDISVPEAGQLPSPKIPSAEPVASRELRGGRHDHNRVLDGFSSSPPTYSESPPLRVRTDQHATSSRVIHDPRDKPDVSTRRSTMTNGPFLEQTIPSQDTSQQKRPLTSPSPRNARPNLSEEDEFDLYPIGDLHKKLVSLWERQSRGTLFGLLKGKVPQNPRLKDFIKDRDIIFLVDNGWHMRPHWSCAKKVLETLAMQIGPLDDNGLDLRFTIGDNNKDNIRGFDIKPTFQAAMTKAEAPDDQVLYQTPMAHCLLGFFRDHQWKISAKQKLTIIILTTGEWEPGVPNDVEKIIANTIRELCKKHEHFLLERLLTIQFISFGDNPQALERLSSLDNDLGRHFNIPDVIDTEPWKGNPDKMVLGSIKSSFDGQDTSDMRSPLSPEGDFSLSSQSTSSANMDSYMHSRSVWARSRSPSPRPSSQHTSSRASILKSARNLFQH
ncbi:kinase-like domain-containing protein [Triangularia verruculosa]|uniref:Kinase-like domain-containing protein n=1 Tax=Triangularia verruculosa TaxID=2587418 RepID=A0AAN6XDP9_9PEZI|nr:kinase-like domain-containing protein [Triangularia verruculosa]